MNRRPRQRQPFILRNRSRSLRGRHWKGGVSMVAVLPWKMLPYPLAILVKLRLNCSLSVILGKIQSERQILYLLLNVSVSMAESESGCVSLREDWAKWRSETLRTYDLYLNGQDPLNMCALPAQCDGILSLKSQVSPSSLSALKQKKKRSFATFEAKGHPQV